MKKVWLCAWFCLVFAVLVNVFIHKRHNIVQGSMSELLYLPSGKYLKAASFGYHSLVADFVYLWSIQYYGNMLWHPRVEYMKHVYEIVAELDPQFMDAYRTGAFMLFYFGKDQEAALDLLDLGLHNNPHEWLFPTDAGFYCLMGLKDKRRAVEYFESASQIPGAPSMVKRIRASLLYQLGEKEIAYALWREVYETDDRPSVRNTAIQHLHDLKVLIDLEQLNRGIEVYRSRFQKVPLNLGQLVTTGILQAIPTDPEGDNYLYQSQKGTVLYPKPLKLYKTNQ